jgi:ribonuclease E
VALYVLNQKRAHLRSLEERFAITLTVVADATVMAPQAFVIDRGEQVHTVEAARALAEQNQQRAVTAPLEDEDDLEDESIVEEVEVQAEDEDVEAAPTTVPEHGEGEGEPRRRRRRRGRGGRGGRDGRDGGEHREHIPIHEGSPEYPTEHASEPVAEGDDEASAGDEVTDQHGEPAQAERGDRPDQNRDGERRGRRRRGRRGGRRNRHDRDRNGDAAPGMNDSGAPAPQHSFGPGDELAPPAAAEPEFKEAVADLDAAPPSAPPAPVSAEPAHTEQQAEPPRRRSTVRERAPIGGSGDDAPPPAPPASAAPAPAPEPAITEVAETEGTDRPRKTGWWSRRFAGG